MPKGTKFLFETVTDPLMDLLVFCYVLYRLQP